MSSIIVTGGAGFIGSNLVKALNAQGECKILVVDDLTQGEKFRNLADCDILDYLDKDEFLARIHAGDDFGGVRAVFHQGACSTTTEWDGRYMLRNNYDYSKTLLHWCQAQRVAFIYASTAALYGITRQAVREERAAEAPLNVYGYSKLLFDQYVRRVLPRATAQIVGLRYFNVYGPREQHKGGMASVAWHFHNQLLSGDTVRLFEGSDGYADGAQRRDFVYVGDVCAVNLWFSQHPGTSGIFNVGSGRSQTFNEVAEAVIAHHGRGRIEYIPFPETLRGCYQSFTEADIGALRAVGYDAPFRDVASGVREYLAHLSPRNSA